MVLHEEEYMDLMLELSYRDKGRSLGIYRAHFEDLTYSFYLSVQMKVLCIATLSSL